MFSFFKLKNEIYAYFVLKTVELCLLGGKTRYQNYNPHCLTTQICHRVGLIVAPRSLRARSGHVDLLDGGAVGLLACLAIFIFGCPVSILAYTANARKSTRTSHAFIGPSSRHATIIM
jgi:hypothetical protein